MKLNDSFLAQMRDAANLLHTEGPMAATEAIQRALHGDRAASDASTDAAKDTNAPLPAEGEVLDAESFAGKPGSGFSARANDFLARFRNGGLGAAARQNGDEVVDVEVHEDAVAKEKGRFISGSCTNAAGTRSYKLYVPSGYTGQTLPAIVMLHGCTQNPDDFARGTGMNALAEEQNCFVIYPGQSKSANASNCWNWFQPTDQGRDRGEPSIVADIVRQVARDYRIDASRTYVAGLSAGGAMASILGATYPELFAAIGVHSGLPSGAAHDMPSAFAAMKSRKGKVSARHAMPAERPLIPYARPVPVIVFHGDADRTVHSSNGDKVLRQCRPGMQDETRDAEQGRASSGKTYTRAVHRDAKGRVVAEQWTLHGGGHAWAGGSKKGSYTDPAGPDASREMLRFFLSHAL